MTFVSSRGLYQASRVPDPHPVPRYRFGGLELDPARLELRRLEAEAPVDWDEASVTLTPGVCAVLRLFLDRAGGLVSRREIGRVVGGEGPPTRATVDHYIKAIREMVDAPWAEDSHLVTVHGRGFRFLLDVEEVVPEDPGVETGATA